MKKRQKLSTKDIAVAAIFLSLILIFVLVPIPTPSGVSMAFIPLIAVILAATVQGFGMGLFAGTAFGVASLINAFLHPTLMAPMFYNPLVSIVPRMIIPITTYFTFRLMKKLLSKRSEDAGTFIACTVSSVVGVVTNTGLVLSMMAAFNFGKVFGETVINAAFFGGLLGVNFLFEVSICAVVAPIITTGLRIALRIDRRGKRPVNTPVSSEVLEIGSGSISQSGAFEESIDESAGDTILQTSEEVTQEEKGEE